MGLGWYHAHSKLKVSPLVAHPREVYTDIARPCTASGSSQQPTVPSARSLFRHLFGDTHEDATMQDVHEPTTGDNAAPTDDDDDTTVHGAASSTASTSAVASGSLPGAGDHRPKSSYAKDRRVKVKAKKTGGYRHHNDILPERQRKPIYTRQRLRKTLLIRFWPKKGWHTCLGRGQPCIPPDPSGSHAEKCKHCSDNGAPCSCKWILDRHRVSEMLTRLRHQEDPSDITPTFLAAERDLYAQYNATRTTSTCTLLHLSPARDKSKNPTWTSAKLQFYTDVTSAVRTIFARFDRIAKTTRSDDEEHDVERSYLQSICEASGLVGDVSTPSDAQSRDDGGAYSFASPTVQLEDQGKMRLPTASEHATSQISIVDMERWP
ncbi:hypothetical protein PANT_9c00297 [Moesziomyces antarcticus T-34]|uniref:Uncharacterized protein n=1 Tax=Pseudozyma antarctica (strain T-34) TaxID=1151754 RepID=M9LP28_PSEA3|nr:hypothetical protein PANT_9c00297 [Moesziomyces antarcticus T-34]